ncbi:MAG: Eco57I restriction-modification methylase domain-containing protein, partial [Bacilli bacterium]
MYKTDCYLFDFAPDRVLKIVTEYASDLINDGSGREQKIKKLLNFLTVLAEDNEGNLKELNAREILELPLKIITKEVVSRGFMSNKLFDNIANIFGMNTELREIVNKLTPEKNKRINKPTNMSDNNIKLDDLGNIITTESEIEHIINTSNGRLVQKEYAVEGTPEALVIQEQVAKYAAGEIELDKQQIDKLNNTEIITKEEEMELVKEELTKIKEKDKNSEENQIRDRLRGFSRTIPTFLMAYSRKEQIPTLNNFDMDIPDSEFKDLTSISKEEFHKLKDAKLFNEEVFNASIREFIETKKRLADYFINTEEDIFDFIPPQKTNQIYTPKRVVKKMVDLLEENDKNIFKSKDATFIDLYMKSGLFVAEIVKRLYKGLKDEIPNEKARIIHILTNQVFGIAPTDILYNICFEYILGFLKDNVNFSSNDIYTLSNNFKKLDMIEYIQEDKNWRKELFGENMKFDVIIGNPPYQELVANNSNTVSQANPVYNLFIENATKISNRYVSMISPSLWMTGGTGLSDFRKYMLEQNHIKVLHDYEVADNIFNDVAIAGGVSYFLWDNKFSGKTKNYYYRKDCSTSYTEVDMAENGTEIFIRDSVANNILKKIDVFNVLFESFMELVST